jgi:di/tripeptidase
VVFIAISQRPLSEVVIFDSSEIQLVLMLIFSPGVAQPQIFTIVFRWSTILDAIILGSFIFAKVVVVLNNKKTIRNASIEFLIRDFDTPNLKLHADRLLGIAQNVLGANPDFSKVKLSIEINEQYRNMREVIDQYPEIVNRALKAYKKASIEPKISPIRGGTDGSRMSFMGLATPNIFTGMQAIHSKHEWIGVRDMLKAVEVLVNLVEIN